MILETDKIICFKAMILKKIYKKRKKYNAHKEEWHCVI